MSNATVLWKGETATAEDANVTFTARELSPKRLTAVLPVSKQFLMQTSNSSIEQLLYDNLQRCISEKLEATIFSAASGSTTQPDGLFVGAATGVTATYSGITSYEASLENKNVNDYVFILNPNAKAKLKNVKINEGQMLVANELVDGRKSYTSSFVSPNGVIIGDMRDYCVAQFGLLDIDVESRAKDGMVDIVINAWFDAAKMRDSFVAFTLA
jgi:HK97 family phage major capsid protein